MQRSRAFYGLFGFTEQRAGGEGDATWSYVQSGDATMLLAALQPALITVELPLLIYLYVDDAEAAMRRLTDAGYGAELVGYPDHAPGGEARTTDPDGNVVLFGQRAAVPAHARRATGDARSSLMEQAARAVRQRGGAPAACQIGFADGRLCGAPAEVKLADPWGETVWGCLPHAEEALIGARSAFIAVEDGQGLGEFLRGRRPRRS
jgi:predicted enzyme related to lactoylglutathione lyase